MSRTQSRERFGLNTRQHDPVKRHRAPDRFTPKPREEPAYQYEDEDQSALLGLRLGAKVRHPQFGVGTILSVEELADDVKLVVRFSVGPKTLRAKYAKLELA